MDDQTQQLPVCPPSFTEKGEKAEIVKETQFLPKCAPTTVLFFLGNVHRLVYSTVHIY